ncbi:8091_t:CDS:2 [Dentiscutata erythropus]|uniref:8091_t:CDS:1 n=1 Tax=Dentiscutata erythropus TaxID=1348616 RepID=A0A9N9ENS0_9GLOM|nr:8091_t:CDS:2 [Dentiscutata erythropus]
MWLNSDSNSDVKMIAGSEPNIKEFSVHSSVLRSCSLYFQRALSERWKDQNMVYIYAGKNILNTSPEDSLKILVASDELELLDLIECGYNPVNWGGFTAKIDELKLDDFTRLENSNGIQSDLCMKGSNYWTSNLRTYENRITHPGQLIVEEYEVLAFDNYNPMMNNAILKILRMCKSPCIVNTNKELDIHCRYKKSYFLLQVTNRQFYSEEYLVKAYRSFNRFLDEIHDIDTFYNRLFVIKLVEVAEELKSRFRYQNSDQNIIYNENEVINIIKSFGDNTEDQFYQFYESDTRHKQLWEEEIRFIENLKTIELIKIRHSYNLGDRNFNLDYCRFDFVDKNFKFVVRYENTEIYDQQENYLVDFDNGISAHMPPEVWGIYITKGNPQQMNDLCQKCNTLNRTIYILNQIFDTSIPDDRRNIIQEIDNSKHLLQ